MISRFDALPLINYTTASRTSLIAESKGPSSIKAARDEYNKVVGVYDDIFYFCGDGRHVPIALDFTGPFTLFILAGGPLIPGSFGAAYDDLELRTLGDGRVEIKVNGDIVTVAVTDNIYCLSVSSSGLITVNGSEVGTVDMTGFSVTDPFTLGKINGAPSDYYTGYAGIVELIDAELDLPNTIEVYRQITARYSYLWGA